MVNRNLAQAIVGSLQLSGAPYDFGQLAKFSTRDWERCLGWLDRSGLTLYLLQQLRDRGATEVLPARVLARFEQNLSDNKCRVQRVLAETGSINAKFESAGVQYVVVKGMSLWPEFCSDPCLRTQTDIDYLIAGQSLAAAKNALAESGYEARGSSQVQFEYELPLQRVPSPYDSPYKPQTTPTVELHLGVWEDVRHRVPLQEPSFALDNPRMKEWSGLRFPVSERARRFLAPTAARLSTCALLLGEVVVASRDRTVHRQKKGGFPVLEPVHQTFGRSTATRGVLSNCAPVNGQSVFRSHACGRAVLDAIPQPKNAAVA